MTKKTVVRLDWRFPLYAVAGAVAVFLPLASVTGAISSDIGLILYVLIALAVSLVLLLCVAFAKGGRLSFLSMLIVYCVASVALCRNYYDIRTTFRWLLWSASLKAEVLAQPGHGGWKHVEWDGWGFAGAGNTVVYVVYNPSDLLAKAAMTRSPGVVLTPLPREVPRVRRLEDFWYSVVFYTQTDRDHGDEDLLPAAAPGTGDIP